MGLLLGASLITLFEVFDLLIYNWCVKCTDKKRRKGEHSYSPTNVSHGVTSSSNLLRPIHEPSSNDIGHNNNLCNCSNPLKALVCSKCMYMYFVVYHSTTDNTLLL